MTDDTQPDAIPEAPEPVVEGPQSWSADELAELPPVLTPRLLGALPSPDDDRDYLLEQMLDRTVPLPARYVVKGMGAVLNQHNTPMCVAYASSGLKSWEEKRDEGSRINYDEAAFYHAAQKLDGIPRPHDGTTCRAALEVLRTDGISTVDAKSGARHKIKSYWRVNFNEDDLKLALVQFGPLLIATRWWNSWFHPTNGILPAPGDGVAGGHARLLFGWDEEVSGGSFLVRNSWGKRWGVNGNSYDPFRGFLDNVHDAWAALDILEVKR